MPKTLSLILLQSFCNLKIVYYFPYFGDQDQTESRVNPIRRPTLGARRRGFRCAGLGTPVVTEATEVLFSKLTTEVRSESVFPGFALLEPRKRVFRRRSAVGGPLDSV